jgi:probable addiction module antidote protein
MMETKTEPYDVAEFLETLEEMAACLEACIQESEGDAAFIAKALGDTARAKGMTQIARESGLSRESLYKALSGDPSSSFATIHPEGHLSLGSPIERICEGVRNC